jgi:hypothetical protein
VTVALRRGMLARCSSRVPSSISPPSAGRVATRSTVSGEPLPRAIKRSNDPAGYVRLARQQQRAVQQGAEPRGLAGKHGNEEAGAWPSPLPFLLHGQRASRGRVSETFACGGAQALGAGADLMVNAAVSRVFMAATCHLAEGRAGSPQPPARLPTPPSTRRLGGHPTRAGRRSTDARGSRDRLRRSSRRARRDRSRSGSCSRRTRGRS